MSKILKNIYIDNKKYDIPDISGEVLTKDNTTEFTPTGDYNPATKKYVDDNVVQKSATAPASPTEGMLWYDTTNDQLKVYDGTNWNVTGKEYTDGNGINIDANNEISNTGVLSVNGQAGDVTVEPGITKIFTLASTSDLTTAQEAYDWYVAGGNPILVYSNYYYSFVGISSNQAIFTYFQGGGAQTNGTFMFGLTIKLTISDQNVTSISQLANFIQIKDTRSGSYSNNTITLVI